MTGILSLFWITVAAVACLAGPAYLRAVAANDPDAVRRSDARNLAISRATAMGPLAAAEPGEGRTGALIRLIRAERSGDRAAAGFFSAILAAESGRPRIAARWLEEIPPAVRNRLAEECPGGHRRALEALEAARRIP